jgi:hypothetical protein
MQVLAAHMEGKGVDETADKTFAAELGSTD